MSSSNHTVEPVEVKQDRHQVLLTALCTSDFFIFNRKFVTKLKLGRGDALFLQDLINHYAANNTIRTKGGAFLCTVEYLKRSLGWSKATQTRLLNKLVERKYITVLHDEVTGNRWISIDVEKILAGICASTKKEKGVHPPPRLKVSPPRTQSEPTPDSKRVPNKDGCKKDGRERSRDSLRERGAPQGGPTPGPVDTGHTPVHNRMTTSFNKVIQQPPTPPHIPNPEGCRSLPYDKNIPQDEVIARQLKESAKKLKVPFQGRLASITDKVGVLRRKLGDPALVKRVFDFYDQNVVRLTGGSSRIPKITSLGYISVAVFQWWREEMEKRTSARVQERDVMFGYDFDNDLPEHLIH